jgi:hypothetical protein
MGEEQIEEHLRYVETNPHRDQLEKVFELAGIEYGRIDYCVVDGRVQTFEINTNPTVVQGTAYRAGDMSTYADLHEDALTRLLARGTGGGKIPNPFRTPERPGTSAEAASDYAIARVRSAWTRYDPIRKSRSTS